MTNTEADNDQRMRQILFPQTVIAGERMKDGRFVHYTSADVAMSILKNKQVWMRNATTMNDYSEVLYGLQCLRVAFDSPARQVFEDALNACFPDLAREVWQEFDPRIPTFLEDTFLTCVSEHLACDDTRGRLSMWRAYGGQAGVAIVIKGSGMFVNSDALGAYASPVEYLEPEEFGPRMIQVAGALINNVDFARTLGKEGLKWHIFHLLRFTAVCTKHPGFREEQEWRVVASPDLHESSLVPIDIEAIRGIPQRVLKLGLRNHPEQNLIGLALPELLDRIIIGPCAFPNEIRKAFCRILADADVPDPRDKIFLSEIPLRSS